MEQDSSSRGSGSYDAATVDLSGRCVGNSYVLICPIGRGATGTVWRGVERVSGDQVAVKLLHESLLRQPKLVTRFVQERTILLMLRHENIVRVRDLFSVGESLGLVMDLVAGGSLREHLREQGTLAVGEAARLLAQVAGALAEAHGLGVVHRDVKPDNILLKRDGDRLDTRLTDFGIARVLDVSGLTTPHAIVGTPRYMAPEAISGAQPSPAADVYALGVVFYELVAGRPPYTGEPMAVLLGRHLDELPERPTGMPEAAWAVIRSCLEKDPGSRPPADQLTAILGAVARELADVPALPAPAADDPAGDSRDGDGSDDGDAGWAVAAIRPARHPSLPGRARPALPRRRNRPPSWLWGRPGAWVALVGGALLASGLGGFGAWHLRELAAPRPPAASAAGPTTAAVPGTVRRQPVAPTAGRQPSAGPTGTAQPSAPPAQVGVAGRLPVAGGGVQASAGPGGIAVSAGPARIGVSATPGRIGAGAQVFGPLRCSDDYEWDIGHPVLARACYSVGTAIRMVGRMQAPPGVQADVSLTLQEAHTHRVVAGPYTCQALMFTDFLPEHSCGPFDLAAAHGRRYVVVQSWRYTGRSLLPGGTAYGPEFAW